MDKELDVSALKGITQDSRKVESGYLFAALPGSKADGTSFIDDAIAKGATHILAPAGTAAPSNENITFLTDDNPKRKLAQIAAAFYAAQPETIVAVTGTNGKTSTAVFAQQLWAMAGHKSVSMGTIGIHGSGIERIGSLTTPDPVALHKDLAEMAEQGITHLAMEASSHGLDQYRLDGVRLKAAGFTNLSRDHLDYHTDMKSYLAAKMRLFSDLLDEDGVAVLNADVPEYTTIKAVCKNTVSYGSNGKNFKILETTLTPHGQILKLEINGKVHDINFPLVGAFQLMNALCALGLVSCEGDVERYVPFLEKLQGVPGRLQPVTGHPEGAGVFVDYAHTPDALENVLKALRPHTENRLVCVVGCGGDRDKGKRPQMARMASDLSDHVIITDDNPRSEEPAQIRADMIAGIMKSNAQEVPGRRVAIKRAIEMLGHGDVLVIAGKGHEQGQIFANRTEPFDDVREAELSIQSILRAK